MAAAYGWSCAPVRRGTTFRMLGDRVDQGLLDRRGIGGTIERLAAGFPGLFPAAGVRLGIVHAGAVGHCDAPIRHGAIGVAGRGRLERRGGSVVIEAVKEGQALIEIPLRLFRARGDLSTVRAQPGDEGLRRRGFSQVIEKKGADPQTTNDTRHANRIARAVPLRSRLMRRKSDARGRQNRPRASFVNRFDGPALFGCRSVVSRALNLRAISKRGRQTPRRFTPLIPSCVLEQFLRDLRQLGVGILRTFFQDGGVQLGIKIGIPRQFI